MRSTSLKTAAEQQGIDRRTLEQVTATLKNAEKYGSGRETALLMVRHGRLTDEARAYVEAYLEK